MRISCSATSTSCGRRVSGKLNDQNHFSRLSLSPSHPEIKVSQRGSADAFANPRAVVVEPGDANVAHEAVHRVRRAVDRAARARHKTVQWRGLLEARLFDLNARVGVGHEHVSPHGRRGVEAAQQPRSGAEAERHSDEEEQARQQDQNKR